MAPIRPGGWAQCLRGAGGSLFPYEGNGTRAIIALTDAVTTVSAWAVAASGNVSQVTTATG